MQKVAVISGASRGIGKAIAQKYLAEGFQVFISGRSVARLEEFRNTLPADQKGRLFTFSGDMGIKADVYAFAEYVGKHTKEVNILVNNAGQFIPGTIEGEADGTLEQLLQTNVNSAYYLTRALLPVLEVSALPHIFNICSTASIMAFTNGGSYCISKFALLGFSKVLRAELMPKKIKVTSILPGPTLTDSWAGSNLPENRFMKAEDIAELVFTCSNLSPAACVEELLIRPIEGDI
jgi:NADP-dependent 3-hydroxy acid dehydrogenase YdfG